MNLKRHLVPISVLRQVPGILGLHHRTVHGGPEMALHLYPLDHHAWWRERIGDHPALDEPGGFCGILRGEGTYTRVEG